MPPASAMAIDLNTGQILYSKNVSEPRYPASLTKVMTLYLLFDALRDGKLTMATKLKISTHAEAQAPTKLGLSAGDTISVADAIGAIVTKSANDMAVAVAEALAGSEEEFARRMTQKARTIGMLNTTFRNASGLPDPEQRTTAQDLIILGRSILADHPERCKAFATKYFQYDGEVFRNHNTMLFNYEGMEGMKTGFTAASGFNLIATARRGDKRLLAVVLGGQSAGARNAAMRTILDSSWPKAVTRVAAKKTGIQVAVSKPKPVTEAPVDNPIKKDVVPVKAAPARAHISMLAAPYWRLKRRPDRTSISMLLVSIEFGLVERQRSPARASPPPPDLSTDEPEERVEQTFKRGPTSAPPSAKDIARNETLVAQAAPAQRPNVSVHAKTVREPDVMPLAAAVLDEVPETKPVKTAQVVKSIEKEQVGEPQTLAAATVATSRDMDQPGPFHVQVGAFADRAQAEERLEIARKALGPEMVKAHPDFIMQVSLPTGVTMFRARLGRFADEVQAKATCKRLKAAGIDCWDIRAQ